MVRSLVAAAVILALAGGCAHDVRARYPATPGEETGAIVLVFTESSSGVYVAVNGVLVVDDAHTGRVRIENVDTGYADVAIAVGPGEKQVRVWVEAGRDTVLPIGSPGGSPLDALKSLAMSLAGVALYAWLN